MAANTSKSVPILREDDTSLDWPDAGYEARVVIGSGSGRVEHRLQGAAQLGELVTAGKAEWVVELRSPATLYAGMAGSSREPSFTFQWDTDGVTSGSYVIPGMVATQEVNLDPAGLHPVWGESPDRRAAWSLAGARQCPQRGAAGKLPD